MSIMELAQKNVVTVSKDATVQEAAEVMRKYHVGDVFVVEKNIFSEIGIPIGVLTDRDIVLEVVSQNLKVNEVLVGDIMTYNLVTIHPSNSIREAISKMHFHGISRIPIVDGKNNLLGVLTKSDIAMWLAEDLKGITSLPSRLKRKEIKYRPAISEMN